jgi:hypothetical protein
LRAVFDVHFARHERNVELCQLIFTGESLMASAMQSPLGDDTVKPDVGWASLYSQIGETQGDLAASANYFGVDPVLLASASMQPYQRAHQDPIYRPLRIYTLDPTASRLDGAVATLNVPFERLNSGPVGSFLEVVDWDQTTGQSNKSVDLDNPRILIEDGRTPSSSDPMFRQQMVYAVQPYWDYHCRPPAPIPSWCGTDRWDMLAVHAVDFRGDDVS